MNLFKKTMNVINSCQNMKQLDSAYRYSALAQRKLNHDKGKRVMDSFYFKEDELMFDIVKKY